MGQIASRSLEMKEGIIWSIDTTARNCGIRIIGSTDSLKATFPPSWSIVPSWVQLGCPVQMRYRGGFRNALEIVGPGQTIPTPAAGNYSPTPDATSLPDQILSGCQITEIPLIPQMAVMIHTGVIRIGGSTITIDAIKADSTFFKMDMGGNLNDVAAVIPINTAPTDISDIRYDIFAAGVDGVIDYLAGTTFKATATAETLPSVAADHLEIGRVLISAEKTILRNKDVNAYWSPVGAHALSIAADSTNLLYNESTAAITVTVLDRYEHALIKDAGYGWRIELEIINGTGSIASSETTSTSVAGAYAGASAGYTFSYTRDGTAADISPLFAARLIAPAIENRFTITLRDSSGDIMTS